MREPTQRELDLRDAERERYRKRLAEQREDALDRLMATVFARLGAKHFADALGLDTEELGRIYGWKDRRNGQRPPAEMLLAVVIADDEAMGGFCQLAGYEVPRRTVNIAPEELARHYRAALLQFGERGAELDRQIRSGSLSVSGAKP